MRIVLDTNVLVEVEVTVDAATTIPYTIMASPKFLDDGVRFVLTWGGTPTDLDAHLITPNGDEVLWSNKTPAGSPEAILDIDDTTSYGPETITINGPVAGTYEFYVHNYSGSPDITTSEAVVIVYFSDNRIFTYKVPTSGTGQYWRVGTLDGATSTFTYAPTITATAPDTP